MLRPVWLNDDVIWENKVYCDGDWHQAQLTRVQFLLFSDPKKSFDLAKNEFEWEPFKVKHGTTGAGKNTYNVSWEKLQLSIGFEREDDRMDFLRRYTAREYAFSVNKGRLGTTLGATIRRAKLHATELAKTSYFSDHESRIEVAQLYIKGLSEIAGIVEGAVTKNYAATVSSGLKVLDLILDGVRGSLQCDPLIKDVKEAIRFWEEQLKKHSLDHYHSFKFVLECLMDLIGIVEFSTTTTSTIEMVAAGSVVAEKIRDALATLKLHQDRLLLEVSLETRAKDDQLSTSTDVRPEPVFGDSFVEYSVEPQPESRDSELHEIEKAFESKKIVILHGLPGIGKSTLAKFYSETVKSNFRTVLVSLARVDLNPQSVLRQVCDLLEVGKGKIGDELKEAFRRHSAETPLLVIIDDILSLHALNHLKCIDNNSRILCTSLQCEERDDITHVRVHSLQRADAMKTLLRNARLTEVATKDEKQVDRLLQMLDGCAFRLVMAGKMFSQSPTKSWQTVIKNVMKKRPSSLYGEYRPTNSQMVGSVYDFLHAHSEVDGYADAVRMIPALSVFATRRMNDRSQVKFENGSCSAYPFYFRLALNYIGLSKLRVDSALEVLRNFGFYSENSDMVSIHSEILMFAVEIAKQTKFDIENFVEGVLLQGDLFSRFMQIMPDSDVNTITLDTYLRQNRDSDALTKARCRNYFSAQCVFLCHGLEIPGPLKSSRHARFNLDFLTLKASTGERYRDDYFEYKDEFLCVYGGRSWQTVQQMRLLEKMEAVDVDLNSFKKYVRQFHKICLMKTYFEAWEQSMGEVEVKECFTSKHAPVLCVGNSLHFMPLDLLPVVLPYIKPHFDAKAMAWWCDQVLTKRAQDCFEDIRTAVTARDKLGRTLMFYTTEVLAWTTYLSIDELDLEGYTPLAVNARSDRKTLCRMGALLQTPTGTVKYHPILAEYGYVDPIEGYDEKPKIEVPIVRSRGTYQPQISDFLP